MDLYDALTDAEAAAADVARQRAHLLAQVESMENELNDLQVEIEGLKRAIARHERRLGHPGSEERRPITDEQTPTIASAPSEHQQVSVTNGQGDGDWQSLPRTEAVEKMLAEVDTPISPMNLSRKLQEVGRADDALSVGKALNHLYRKHRANSVGRAQWVLVRESESPSGIPPKADGMQDEQEKEVSDDQEVSGAAPTFTEGGHLP